MLARGTGSSDRRYHAGVFWRLARRRKRRSSEKRSSVRLGVLLVGLVGVNVYVFLFNHRTAPRDVLHMQSTSRTLEQAAAKDKQAAAQVLAAKAAEEAQPPIAGAPA